jgi:hypothetical protein
MVFGIRFKTLGGHVHCRLFSGPHEGALGKCGELCMRVEEFDLYQRAATFMQFLPEEAR